MFAFVLLGHIVIVYGLSQIMKYKMMDQIEEIILAV